VSAVVAGLPASQDTTGKGTTLVVPPESASGVALATEVRFSPNVSNLRPDSQRCHPESPLFGDGGSMQPARGHHTIPEDNHRGVPPYDAPTEADRYQMIRTYFQMLIEEELPDAVGKMKQFASWFTHGVPGGAALRKSIYESKSPPQILERVEDFFEARLCGAGTPARENQLT
jgi:tRNA-dihydrouridine synthase